MENIGMKINDKGEGGFYIEQSEEEKGEMIVRITTDTIFVYHTEVSEAAEGKGLAKQLLLKMVAYAREHGLKVMPLCPYVFAQFKKHPEEYSDIWIKTDS